MPAPLAPSGHLHVQGHPGGGCPTSDVQSAWRGTLSTPWAEPGSGFTAMFETRVIDWLKEATTAAISRLTGLNWNAFDGIIRRAVERGLSRREARLGIDETAFKKHHDAEDYEDLKGSEYGWLYNPKNMTREQQQRLKAPRDSTLKTARAWAIKELAMSLLGTL